MGRPGLGNKAVVSLREAIAAGFGFWVKAIAGAPVALALLAAASAASAIAPVGLLQPLSALVYLAAVGMAGGALYRLALGKPTGLFGLRFGAVEFRYVLAILLLGLLMVLLCIPAGFVWMIAATYSGLNTGAIERMTFSSLETLLAGPGGNASVGFAALIGVAVLAFGSRLALSSAATVDLERVQVVSSVPLTRGLTVPLMVVIALFNGPWMILALVRFANPGANLPLSVAVALVEAFVTTPLIVGALAHIYRRVTSSEAVQ